MSDPKTIYKHDGEIQALVSEFEACSFHPSEFKHYQHLTVALWYITRFPYDEAVERMKDGIRRLATTYGKTGYHETITVFWLSVVRDFLADAATVGSVALLANQLIDRCVDKDLIRDYYSSELLASARAKAEWVEPDLKPLGLLRGCSPTVREDG